MTIFPFSMYCTNAKDSIYAHLSLTNTTTTNRYICTTTTFVHQNEKVLIFVLKRTSSSFKTQPKIKSIPEWDAFFLLYRFLLYFFLKVCVFSLKFVKWWWIHLHGRDNSFFKAFEFEIVYSNYNIKLDTK